MTKFPDMDASPAEIIDSRMQKYASLGYSREKTLHQLLSARLPVEILRTRFPEMPESAFVVLSPNARHSNLANLPSLELTKKEPQLESVPPAVHSNRTLSPPKVDLHPQFTSPGLQPIANSQFPSATNRSALTAAVTEEAISFQYVPLIQCSFPHADPGSLSSFTRRNGWLELTLGTTRPDTGLPYGVPARLLTIYCASEAMRTRSPEIYLGKSVHDFLRLLDIPITRGSRGSLTIYTNQLLRLIHSTLSIDENIQDAKGRAGLHIRQALFVEEAQLWWDDPTGSKNTDRTTLSAGSSLLLSRVLFDSILERSAPLATSAIKQLRKSPMDLDVYAWLVHRLFNLSKPSMVNWTQLAGQFGHNYSELRMFRRFFSDSLKRVLAVYPEAKLNVTQSGVLLLPSRPHVARSVTSQKS